MAATISMALNLERGITYQCEDSREADTLIEQLHSCAEVAAGARVHSPVVALNVKSEVPSSGNGVSTQVVGTAWQNVSNARGSRTVEASTVSRILALRTTLTAALENERQRLVMARFEVEKPTGIIRRRLAKERDLLRTIDQKIVEKSGAHDRAANQYQRARDMLNAAKFDKTVAATAGTILAKKSMMETCEEFVEAWIDNVATAYAELECWELKKQRATERVASLLAELSRAEEQQRKKQTILDNSLTNLQALDGWLSTL